MPYLMFIYWLAYLDRANLSVAKLQMQQDLGFSDSVIGFGAGIFFLGFLLLDIDGSLIVERWSARKWIARFPVDGLDARVHADYHRRKIQTDPLYAQLVRDSGLLFPMRRKGLKPFQGSDFCPPLSWPIRPRKVGSSINRRSSSK
jgi:ACS family tartrate transporter-like MFS transporter